MNSSFFIKSLPFDQAMNLWSDKQYEMTIESHTVNLNGDIVFNVELYIIMHPTVNIGKGCVFWFVKIGEYIFKNYSAELCYNVYKTYVENHHTEDFKSINQLIIDAERLIWENPEDLRERLNVMQENFIKLMTSKLSNKKE